MSRRKRLKIDDRPSYYHVMSFTVSDEYYLGKIEKERLTSIIRRYSKLYFVNVITYCIMSNHFHLLIKMGTKEQITDEELRQRIERIYNRKDLTKEDLKKYRYRLSDLSDYIKTIKQVFSRWYNKINNRRGYFWGDRFKSLLIGDGKSLLTCMAYIDLNPIRAGIVNQPEKYRWSGIGYRIQQGNTDSFLSYVGTGIKTLKRYKELIYILGKKDKTTEKKKRGKISEKDYKKEEEKGFETRLKGKLTNRIKYFTDGLVIGSNRFVKQVYSRFSDRFGKRKKKKPTEIYSGLNIFCIKKPRT